MKTIIGLFFIVIISSCNSNTPTETGKMNYPTTGTIERIDPALDALIDTTASAEIIAEGLEWSEGPLWVEKHNMLLFSDVPRDTIFKWTEAKGKELYLTPSGYTERVPRGGEMGSNGLTLDNDGKLVLCQCGNRQMARMEAALDRPQPVYQTLAATYEGKRFNSPNDVVYNSKGELYFTDPPYGLEKGMEDPKKELPFQGVYKVKTTGEVMLVTDTLTRPNGLAFLPGEKTLIVANSDTDKPNWYAFEFDNNDSIVSSRLFYSAAEYDASLNGLPDGLKIDKQGNVFATGPGGVWVFNSSGKLLGKIKFDLATSNIALSPDEKTMYITNHSNVLRLKMRN